MRFFREQHADGGTAVAADVERQLDLVDAEVWRKIVENVRRCVEFYETTFVTEIDAIYS